MKLLMYKVNTKKSVRGSEVRINPERVLFLAFIVTFMLLIIVQAALMSPSIRTFLVANDEFDGNPLGVEEFLYKQGEIALELMNEKNNSNIKVLINGDIVDEFSSSIIHLKVKDGDVVEIDGSGSKNESVVIISSKSDNISTECVNKGVKVKSNIRKLVEVRMK